MRLCINGVVYSCENAANYYCDTLIFIYLAKPVPKDKGISGVLGEFFLRYLKCHDEANFHSSPLGYVKDNKTSPACIVNLFAPLYFYAVEIRVI